MVVDSSQHERIDSYTGQHAMMYTLQASPDGFLGPPAPDIFLQGALQQAGGARVFPGPAGCARLPKEAAHIQPAPMTRLNVGAQPQSNLHETWAAYSRLLGCVPLQPT